MALLFNNNTPDRVVYNNNNVSKVYYNGILVWPEKVLPVEYQEVEYIESTGTQYINTGIASTQYITANLDMQFTEYSPSSMIIIAWSSGAGRWFGKGGLNTYSGGDNAVSDVDALLRKEIEVFFTPSTTGFTIDGTTYSKATTSSQSNGYTLFAGRNSKNNMSSYASAKLYKATIQENGETIRDLVPCYRKIDNKPGLYDLVNDVFYTNAGTGEFNVGADVIVLPADYQRVEYLESSGTQYIDTGSKLSDTSNVYLKYQYVTGTVSGRVMGDATNANTKWLISCSGAIPTTSVQFGLDGQWVPSGGGFPIPNYDVVEARTVGPALSATVNGVTQTATYSGSSFTTTNNASLFKAGTGFAWCRIYRCQIDNTRDLVPCYRKIDNVPGMYDIVNNVFYTNAGSGVFTVGPDVI